MMTSLCFGRLNATCGKRYADRYRVMRADSGKAALDLIRQLQLRNESVALFLSDQRMPGMTGVEFLEQAKAIYPDARRVLLTAYSDTEAAINSINRVQVNHYLLKPWDPPEQNLYPVLDDLLDDWQADYRPPFEGVRVIGARWSPQTHAVKDFLARNHVPYTWIDVEAAETDPDAQRLLAPSGTIEAAELPAVLLPDGSHLNRPTPGDIAQKARIANTRGKRVLRLADHRRRSRWTRRGSLRRFGRSSDRAGGT